MLPRGPAMYGALMLLALAGATAPLPGNESADYTDILVLGPRPVVLRIHIFIDERTWSADLRQRAESAFAALDQKKRGRIDVAQADDFSRIAKASLPNSPLTAGAQSSDTDPADGQLSLQEFIHFYLSQIAQPCSLVAGLGRPTSSIQLFDFLDADGDGRLQASEFDTAQAQLAGLDFDEDETVSFLELQPFRNPLLPVRTATRIRPVDLPLLPWYESAVEETSERLWSRYTSTPGSVPEQTTGIVAEVLNLLVDDSSRYDADQNGYITRAELSHLLQNRRPFRHLFIRIPSAPRVRPAIAVHETVPPGSPFSSRRAASDRLTLQLPDLNLELRTQGALAQSRDNQSFYLLQFRVADANKNGYLEPSEFPALQLPDVDFTKLDTDQNGMLVRDELRQHLNQDTVAAQSQIVLTAAANERNLFEVLDADIDLRLTRRELGSVVTQSQSLDRNQDGILDRSELSRDYRLTISLGKPRLFRQETDVQPVSRMPTPRAPNTGAPNWFQHMDRNQDGDVSWNEFLGDRDTFDRFDQDRDGLIGSDEAKREPE